MAIEYHNFNLKFNRYRKGYICEASSTKFGDANHQFTLPFTSDKIESFLQRVEDSVSTRSMSIVEIKKFGGKLFETVFEKDIRGIFKSCSDYVDQVEGLGLRIRLHLKNIPELSYLPWEYLYQSSTDQFICLKRSSPIVRYLDVPIIISPLSVKLPLKILVMASSPLDVPPPPLNVEREKKKIYEALDKLIKDGKVAVDYLEIATAGELQRKLRTSQYHVFHYIGHGIFDIPKNKGFLIFENERKKSHHINAEQLGAILMNHEYLRLVVLNCCEGAKTLSINPFTGTATTLVRQGIPAVVAMQFSISDPMAIKFASIFYEVISEGHPIDVAVTESRVAVFFEDEENKNIEWGTPVLFMRSSDGILFKIDKKEETISESALSDSNSMSPSLQKSKLGSIAHKMCNRERQVNEFGYFFRKKIKECPKQPQFCVIHGKEYESHESLVERLINTKITDFTKQQLNEYEAAILSRPVPWPNTNDLEKAKLDLKCNLFERFDEHYFDDDLSVNALSQLSCLNENPIVVIVHNIDTSNWHSNDKNLLVWYIQEYWSELKCNERIPQFLIFLNIIYPGEYKIRLTQKIFKNYFSREVIIQELERIHKSLDIQCPCYFIEELRPLTKKDVRNWFRIHIKESELIREQVVNSIFQENSHIAEVKSMAEIEVALEKIVKEYRRKEIQIL